MKVKLISGQSNIAQLFLLKDTQNVFKKEQTGKLSAMWLFHEARVKCGELFVLSIKIKCNDFSDKNIFSADAVKAESETLVESPIKTHLFDV